MFFKKSTMAIIRPGEIPEMLLPLLSGVRKWCVLFTIFLEVIGATLRYGNKSKEYSYY